MLHMQKPISFDLLAIFRNSCFFSYILYQIETNPFIFMEFWGSRVQFLFNVMPWLPQSRIKLVATLYCRAVASKAVGEREKFPKGLTPFQRCQ